MVTKQLPADVPAPGRPAPAFELVSETGETVSLSGLRGKKVVLFFYPKAMTSGCTIQACAFRDSLPQFDAKNAVIFGISPDPVEDLQKFKEQEGLNYTLLSDESTQVARAYGVWGEKSMYGRKYDGIIRSQFVIDEEGRIQAVQYDIKPQVSVEEALAVLG